MQFWEGAEDLRRGVSKVSLQPSLGTDGEQVRWENGRCKMVMWGGITSQLELPNLTATAKSKVPELEIPQTQ